MTISEVTTAPAIMTPASIARKAFLNLNPKIKAAAQPVQAPGAGSGIPTNIASPIEPYFSKSALCLRWVRSKSQVKNISPIFQRLR